MKILIITPKIPYPPIDGHKKSMFGVIKYLSLIGYKIDLVCYKQDENEHYAKPLEKYAQVHLLDVRTSNTVVGVLQNLFSSVPYNLWKYKNTKLVKFLKKFLKSNEPDIIHIVNSHMGWIVDYLREFSNAPIVLRQENLELSIMEKYYQNQENLLLKLYSFCQFQKFLNYEPELCRKFDLCLMMSYQDEEKLKQLNQNVRTEVIPLGVDEELFNLERESVEPYSLFHIGSLSWYPNLDGITWFINKIFPTIIARCPNCKLYLYGGGIPKNFRYDAKLESNIVIKGFVQDIWKEINSKQLAIVPLRIGGGIRVKILELLAAGHYVISTKIGAEGIPVEDGKNVIIADTNEEFTEKILSFFESKSISFMNDSGRDLIQKNYSWGAVAGKLDSLYQKLLSNGHR
jgi:glycosyltransferase involved in cell wall biosynthesis